MLNPNADIDLSDDSWRIYSRTPVAPPHYISSAASVKNSIIAEGCEISGDIDFSVLFENVTVEQGAVVKDSIIMPGTVVKSGAVVQYAIIAENAVIESGASVGERPENSADIEKWGIAVVGKGVNVGSGRVVSAREMVDAD